jgi:hypothetical protein
MKLFLGLRATSCTVAACLLAVLAGCSEADKTARDKSKVSSQAEDGSEVSYHEHLRPIIEANCVECHHEGGIGPMPLDNWQDVKRTAPLLVAAVRAGRMPPWPADDSCREMADARGLSDDVKKVFADWESGGFNEGNPDDYEPPEPRRRLSIGEPSRVFEADAPFTPAPNSDTYRCFYVGAVDADTYLTAVDLIPGAKAEVHHIQFHRVDAANIPAVQAMQDADALGGYACGSSGVGGSVSSQNMFSWRPGSLAVLFNPGDAAYLKKGSGLVLQIHYNTQFLPEGEVPVPDASQLALWTLPPGTAPERVIYRTGVLSPLSGASNGTNPLAFLMASIPANKKDVIGESTVPMSSLSRVGAGLGIGLNAAASPYIPGEIVGMTPHAHSWATRMTASIRQAGDDQCLIEVPDWDYGWQLDYLYKEGLSYGPDDMLHVACHYDNTADNQPTIAGMRRVPQPITFGENTLNEMCLHYLWLRFKYEDFAAANPG